MINGELSHQRSKSYMRSPRRMATAKGARTRKIANSGGFSATGWTLGADWIAVAALTAAWAGMVGTVNPVGDFPLNDDWAYGYSVKILLEQGEFRFSDWTATNLIAQVVWGTLFALPFDFSFTALRLSTLTLGWVGLLATYGLLRELRAAPLLAFAAATLVAANPIYLALSHSFMTDVPFVALATLSLYFLLRGLRRESGAALAFGFGLSALAILTRQVGLCLPLAFGCAYVAKRGITRRTISLGALPALAGLGLQVTYQQWLTLTLREPANYGNQIRILAEELSTGVWNIVSNFTRITLYSAIYLGLFLFPLLILLLANKWPTLSRRQRTASALTLGATVGLLLGSLYYRRERMPLWGNILVDHGIGPIDLKGVSLPVIPSAIWLVITVVGAVGAALIVYYFGIALLRIARPYFSGVLVSPHWELVFLCATAVIYYAPLGFLGLGPFGFYDRYLLFFLPLLAAVAAIFLRDHQPVPRKAMAASLLLTGAMALFSTAATHDYLALHRARWQALRQLTHDRGIPPSEIDGGFEFNAWYLFDKNYDDWRAEPEKSWYWVDRDTYAVTLSPLEGYKEIGYIPLRLWLGTGESRVLLLEKLPDASSQKHQGEHHEQQLTDNHARPEIPSDSEQTEIDQPLDGKSVFVVLRPQPGQQIRLVAGHRRDHKPVLSHTDVAPPQTNADQGHGQQNDGRRTDGDRRCQQPRHGYGLASGATTWAASFRSAR